MTAVRAVSDVATPRLPAARLAPLIGGERFAQLQRLAAETRAALDGATVWNVNSTATGGGVAEMLRVLVGYTLDLGIDVRWSVVAGDAPFFATTKRLHNRLHGVAGDGGELGAAEQAHYAELGGSFAAELAGSVRPGDVVLLHDPQTAAMAARLREAGAHVVWRCHVGVDEGNGWTAQAWDFLRPHIEACERFVFSRRSYAPGWVPPALLEVIEPSIDPFSPKNEELPPGEVLAVLRAADLLGGGGAAAGGRVRRRAEVVREGAPLEPERPLVLQVSRWDHLKDMAGVMAGFVAGVARQQDAHLLLAGPATAGVSDDPEGAAVLDECLAAWRALDGADRRRVSLASLPMADVEENALIVNALQRHATVVVQKSLAEGFGLTVAEAMWKSRAVVASAVGGIRDQVTPGTGVLLEDPTDLAAFGASVARLLADPQRVAQLGAAARQQVLAEFVGDHHLAAYARLVVTLCRGPAV